MFPYHLIVKASGIGFQCPYRELGLGQRNLVYLSHISLSMSLHTVRKCPVPVYFDGCYNSLWTPISIPLSFSPVASWLLPTVPNPWRRQILSVEEDRNCCRPTDLPVSFALPITLPSIPKGLLLHETPLLLILQMLPMGCFFANFLQIPYIKPTFSMRPFGTMPYFPFLLNLGHNHTIAYSY